MEIHTFNVVRVIKDLYVFMVKFKRCVIVVWKVNSANIEPCDIDVPPVDQNNL